MLLTTEAMRRNRKVLWWGVQTHWVAGRAHLRSEKKGINILTYQEKWRNKAGQFLVTIYLFGYLLPIQTDIPLLILSIGTILLSSS